MRPLFILTFGAIVWTTPLAAKPSLMQQALAAFEQEDLVQAQALIDEAVTVPVSSPQEGLWYYRGVIYEKLLRNQITTEEAPQLLATTLAAYRKVLELAPTASQYHSFAQINLQGLCAYYLDRGRRYYKQEAFESAIKQFDRCKEIDSEDLWAYLYTAIAAHQEEQHDLALNNYNHYLASGTVVPSAVYRSLAYLTAHYCQDVDQALALLEQGLQRSPFDNDLLYERLQLLKALEKEEAEQGLLQKKIEEVPQEAAAHYQLGYWHECQGQHEEALQHYQKVTALAPDRFEPVRQQGVIHYNRAAQITQEAVALADEDFEQQGKEYLKKLKEQLNLALPYFERANKLSRRNAFVLKHLRTLYQRLGKTEKAQKVERTLKKYHLDT